MGTIMNCKNFFEWISYTTTSTTKSVKEGMKFSLENERKISTDLERAYWCFPT